MANKKVSELPQLTSADGTDKIYIIDTSDTSGGASGTSKFIEVSDFVSSDGASGLFTELTPSDDNDTLSRGNYLLNATSGVFSVQLADEAGIWEFSDTRMSTSTNNVLIGTPLQSFTDENGAMTPGPVIVDFDGAHFKVVNVGVSGEYHILNEPELIDIDKIVPTTDAVNSANENDALLANADGDFVPVPLDTIIAGATAGSQGYYGLLTGFYFNGAATETVITESDTDQWVDVNFTIDPSGTFDYRPTDMQEAQASAITGTGVQADPIIFQLEGLSLTSFVNFRASMSFIPDEDESALETRLIFERHSGTIPSTNFPIEELTLTMTQGASVEYAAEPMLSFFIGDTIDTNGVGDAGKCRFQVKSSTEGKLNLRALTWYINR